MQTLQIEAWAGPILLGLGFFAFVCALCQPFLRKADEESVGDDNRVPDAFGDMTRAFSELLPTSRSKLKTVRRDLVRAGFYNLNASINFLSRRNIAVLIVVLLFAVLVTLEISPWNEIKTLVFGIGLSIITYSLPTIFLGLRANRRVRRIQVALPDSLDMVAMAVEGGLPVRRAFDLVASEFESTHRDLSKELMIVSRQTETASLSTALSLFSERMDEPELAAWSTLMLQSQRLGVGIVDSMKDYANRIRETRQQSAEKRGQLMTLQLLLPVILCLVPPIFIFLVGPAVIDLRDFIKRQKQTPTELIQTANSPTSSPAVPR